MSFDVKELLEIKQIIRDNPSAKFFLGVDSQRIRKQRIRFATVVIVHYHDENGIGKGAKVFDHVTYEKVVDAKLSRPINRMLAEVNKVTELFTLLEDVLLDRDFEIHLDISENKSNGSNVAHGAAKGMIIGMVGVEPIFKPHAFAASCAADRFSK